MARVILIQPWNYHDEGVVEHDLSQEWRNGPYSLVLLATQLRRAGHEVRVVDMIRDLVVLKGDVEACLRSMGNAIRSFRPDIIGFGFFSIHYFEVKRAVAEARRVCESSGIDAMFIAGGIHASTEPAGTIRDLGFDYAFKGEADLGLVEIADGAKPLTVQGVVGSTSLMPGSGEEVKPLDDLPFPDWSLCDHAFYATPTYARMNVRKTSSLDMIMGRGCVYKCAFCAYNALSAVRFYSAEYLVEQMEYMHSAFGIDGVYFTDSTIGNNRKLIRAMCDLMLKRGTHKRVEWYANIRPNQISEESLKHMWAAGCRYLFYGFESGSQRVLDLMVKKCPVEANYEACRLHEKLQFPYHASMMVGYPGEREEDILASIDFLKQTNPPSIGVNWYVPLPGSPDYDKLRSEGVINTADPEEWRRIGEVNACRVYADVPETRFRELFKQMERLAYVEIPKTPSRTAWKQAAWGCIAPPQSEITDQPCESCAAAGVGGEVESLEAGRAKASYGAAPQVRHKSA